MGIEIFIDLTDNATFTEIANRLRTIAALIAAGSPELIEDVDIEGFSVVAVEN